MSGPAPREEALLTIEGEGGMRWRVVESAASLLFPGGSFLPEGAVLGRALLRKTRSRTVERIDLAGASVVVKTYVSDNPLERIARRLSGRIPAEAEFDRARELLRLGFPVAEPLAAGFRVRGPGIAESVLVTRFLQGSADLLTLARTVGLPRAVRNRLIDAVARLVRALHDAGATHADLHLANMLVCAPFPRIVLVDLRRVATGLRLGPDDRFEALAALGRASYSVASRTDRLRFLRRYLDAGAPSLGDARALARRIEDRVAALVREHARQRARTALEGDSRFERVSAGGVDWSVRRHPRDSGLARILEDPDGAMSAPGARLLKSGRSSTVAASAGYVIKRFNLKKRRNLVLDRVRPSRARTALSKAIVLAALHIPTAPVVAVGEVRRAGLIRRAYLVMEAIRGAASLPDRLRLGDAGLAAAIAAGALIAKLHRHGLVHRDLKGTNFLVDGAGDVVLIDLDGLAFRPDVTDERAARDLERLIRDVRSVGERWAAAVVEGYRSVRREAAAEIARRLPAR